MQTQKKKRHVIKLSLNDQELEALEALKQPGEEHAQDTVRRLIFEAIHLRSPAQAEAFETTTFTLAQLHALRGGTSS